MVKLQNKDFVFLHTHSHYSLLDGLGKPEAIVAKSKEYGCEAVAITDHGAMYGVIDFYKIAREAGLKPVIGVEAYVAPRTLKDKESKLDSNPYHLCLFAKNFEGYQNLMKLVSIAHLEGYYYKPRIDKATLQKYAKGLIGSSACLVGEIPRAILSKDYKGAKKALQEYQDIFGKEDFYLEIQDHPKIREQGLANDGVIKLARETGVPLIATCDSHYVNKEDREAHDVLVCVQTGKTVDDEKRMIYDGDFSLRDPQELAKAFADVPEALINTKKLADKCDLAIPFAENLLPEYELPKGETPDSFLRKMCERGLKNRYPETKGADLVALKERLKYELSTISKMGFSSYFLIVADYTRWAKEQGIMVGPGRGSVAGALVAYLTNITDVDPIKYGLLFERFLNPDRLEMPDIDLDFADHRRAEVLQYVTDKYGHDKVAGIITFGTMAARAAVRDTGRALGMSYADVDAIAKIVPAPLQGRHIPLEKSVQDNGELREVYRSDPKAKRLLDMATKLEGTVRHASQHASAFVITKEELPRYVPLQEAQKEGVDQITQYSMYPVAELGLLKMDFLGLSNLTIIERALEIIEAVHHDKIDIFNLPLEDKKTFELLGRAETTGVFQLECLSGDTIVSNTTIKKLYERKDRKTLESVYLDEGKIHRNKIAGIFKGKKKKVYNLIASNGWYIKASADHKFLTDKGWKKLSNLKKGDRVLLKRRAKHLIYNECSCGRQISGQKEGKSNFCYRCSAKYYKNPSKPQVRERIKRARLRYYQNGGEPWNKGKNKLNSEILRETGKKIGRALEGRTLEEIHGAENAKRLRRLLSERMRGEKNHMFGKQSPHRKGGFRNDLGHYVRSSWEADFARVLVHLGLRYEYEPCSFKIILSDGKAANYTPDFFIPSENKYYEIKGWMHDLDKDKIDCFRSQHPKKCLEVISATKFAEFELKYKNLVKWECPQVPEQQCHFVKVKEIKPAGVEETYDISMEEPGNNFVANGFVVHNSSGMKRYIKELKPVSVDDVAAMVALYRPGPLQFIDSFIKRRQGKEEVKYPHEATKKALEPTYGIPVYQEQVMQIAKDMAGFTGGEADKLRKAMGKKIAKLMAEMKVKFIAGAQKQGASAKDAQEVFAMLEDFAAYGFNKSHAVCYAMIAYQTAYLKAHYPECFMAALMTSDLSDTDRIAIEIAECERMGIKVLPPDINESFVDFGVVKETGNIRFGLAAIKGIGASPARTIVRERKQNGPYKSLEDFIDRVTKTEVEGAGERTILNKKILESLAKSGALDNMGERQAILAGMDAITERIRETNKDKKSAQIGLFGEVISGEIELGELKLPKAEPAGTKDRLAWEKELLGIYLSEHPLREASVAMRQVASHQIDQLDLSMEGKRVKLCAIISAVKKINTRSGEPMLFVGIEDLSGKAEVLVFPKLLKENEEIWQADKVVIIFGKISTKDSEVKILADKVEEFDPEKIKDIPEETMVTVADDEIVEIDLDEEPEAVALADDLDKRFKDGQFTLERDGLYYVILPPKTKKADLEKLKAVLAENKGEVRVALAYKQNGDYKTRQTAVAVRPSSALAKKVNGVLGN